MKTTIFLRTDELDDFSPFEGWEYLSLNQDWTINNNEGLLSENDVITVKGSLYTGGHDLTLKIVHIQINLAQSSIQLFCEKL